MRRSVQGLAQLALEASRRQLAPSSSKAWPAPALWRGFSDASSLKKTALYDLHVEAGGKMVPFAGWSMPIQYKDSIMDSTINCRENAGLFDVSHMCGLSLRGKDAVSFLERLVVGDIQGMKPGTGTLSVFTTEKGGIIDDTVITKVDDVWIYLVVNAGCRDKDLKWLDAHLAPAKVSGMDVAIEVHDDRSLLALQGPKAESVLQTLTPIDLSKLVFSDFTLCKINGADCFLTRTGYTGEDGFEISVPNSAAPSLAAAIFAADSKVRWTGLGARDSLRLEAGLCLYGHDMNEDITPIEAGLTWTVGKRRRAEHGPTFLGADVILDQIKNGTTKKRVGFISSGAPAREHCNIVDGDGATVGEVTSGGFSPCLKKNIGMGYVKTGLHKSGTELRVDVRGRLNNLTVAKMPFVPTKYVKSVPK